MAAATWLSVFLCEGNSPHDAEYPLCAAASTWYVTMDFRCPKMLQRDTSIEKTPKNRMEGLSSRVREKLPLVIAFSWLSGETTAITPVAPCAKRWTMSARDVNGLTHGTLTWWRQCAEYASAMRHAPADRTNLSVARSSFPDDAPEKITSISLAPFERGRAIKKTPKQKSGSDNDQPTGGRCIFANIKLRNQNNDDNIWFRLLFSSSIVYYYYLLAALLMHLRVFVPTYYIKKYFLSSSLLNRISIIKKILNIIYKKNIFCGAFIFLGEMPQKSPQGFFHRSHKRFRRIVLYFLVEKKNNRNLV